MKLTKRLQMVSSSANLFLVLVLLVLLCLSGLEVQRKMGILKSATMAKESLFGDWWLFFDMVRLSDGWDDEFVTEHKLKDIEPVFHSDIGGRF